MNSPKRIRVKALDRKHKREANVLEKYFNIANLPELKRIRFEIFNPQKNLSERKEAFGKHKKTILNLKPLFKQLVIERNKAAQNEGYKNCFEFFIDRDGVPKEKFKLFLENADKIIKNINQRLPPPPKDSHWFWSEFNIPDFLSLASVPKFSLPNDIFKTIKQMNPKFKKVIPKIKFVWEIKDFNPTTRYDKKKKNIIIEASIKPTIYNALTLVHELGHALSYFECLEKGIEPPAKSRYWEEKQAYKTVFEFEEYALPEKVKNASRGLILGDFLTAFFEYEIYTNPDQDFDKLYAQVHNRCRPQSKQNKNPFYVLENNLVLSPCSVVTASVAEVELLLEKL